MSTKRIFKYELAPNSPQSIDLPEGAEVLTAQGQRDTVCIWALVDPDRPKQKRYFEIFATGESVFQDMGVERQYIGTAQIHGGSLVWHVFERIA